METNLLLLDSYKNIEELIAYAFSFSNRSKRSLKIVYVFDFEWMRQSFMVGSAAPIDPALVVVEKNARKEFKVAETRLREITGDYLKKHSVNVPFEIHISENNRIDVVREEQEKSPGLMLLISNRQSYSEASGGIIGYPNLIEHVNCPVFVIPGHTAYSVMKDVLYATNYHPEDVESLRHLTALLHYSKDVHFTVLHNQPEFDFQEKLKWEGFQHIVKETTGEERFSFYRTAEKDTVSAIEKYAEKHDPDLLVILREKRGFFEELFRSSETRSVLTHFHKPVLVYHENNNH